ncbi:MAG TPA: RNA polymerase factor sigma-54 [Syntrophomonadaceae bacterium]|nr:RNA polymerase factor sigma-54 [Syntrophomonadaceae bacterium]
MRLTHDLFVEQQQKLMMTPELRQAIAILQMSTLELSQYVQQELQENPLLEEAVEENAELETDEIEDKNEDKTEDWLEYFNDRDIGISQKDSEEKSFDNFLSSKPSLYDHLQFQLQMICLNAEEQAVGYYLIGSIDAEGYLSTSLEDVATSTGVDIQRVEDILHIIQSFHPHGIGARDLAECLLIQLRQYGKEDPLAEAIIRDHLDDLARGRINKIARALDTTVYRVQEVGDLIRTLDPKPGLQFSSTDDIKYIIPDIIVEKVEGEYLVVVNDTGFPRLMVNQMYADMLRKPDAFSCDARKYLEEKMGSAVWLIKSIEQRRMTLYKVSRCIVDIQRDFLDRGIHYLKPLNLKQVADMVEVHESTVSRATSNKYMQTPQGLYELKFFFSGGIESCMGREKISSRSIKSLIEDLVAQEDAANPLSDQAITEILKQKGVQISRRTVAKYRQEMGILSTVARKRYD